MNETWSLEMFILPQVIENSRQYLLFRTDICRKQSLGAPASAAQEHNPRNHAGFNLLICFEILPKSP